ncbi:hypothetical protein PENSUB_11654 [Penicillium subrubescens]|uniref:Rhodopsin domain-containing protein n=1 Tax=Penicillium subrubescens TaxID=1316194 RepID=A0A1Q5T2B0_9EURO|nr:hypothetical protein PENSUB_11654 [Penicillium subrubescens]
MGEEHRANYSSPSDGGSALIIVSVVLSFVQIVFVAARFYTRYMQRMKCGLDDWVMLFALFFFVLELLDFPLCITPAKISLLLFYVRIFCIRKFQILVYIVGSLVLAIGITVFFQTIFQCSPISYGWDQSVGPGTCIDQTIFYRYISSFNVLTGILILALPLPLVWKLQAPKAQKIALTAVFLLGGLVFRQTRHPHRRRRRSHNNRLLPRNNLAPSNPAHPATPPIRTIRFFPHHTQGPRTPSVLVHAHTPSIKKRSRPHKF